MFGIDMEALIGLAAAALIATTIMIVSLLKRAVKRREEEMARQGMIYGFTYQAEAEESVLLDLSGLPVFQRGSNKKIRNLLAGAADGKVPMQLFDYQYTLGGGQYSRTFRQSVAVFQLKTAALPAFELKPWNLNAKIASLAGATTIISFKEHPGFSRVYSVSGKNEQAIRALFNQQAMDYLADSRGWTLESDGNRLAVFRLGKRITPQQLPSHISELSLLVRLFVRN